MGHYGALRGVPTRYYAPRENCYEVHDRITCIVESYLGYSIEIADAIRYS